VPCNSDHVVEPAPFTEVSPEDAEAIARDFRDEMARRRTIRDFANRHVPQALIRHAIATAGTAPSGANVQPWRFVVVTDSETKARIREGAEQEEREFYEADHEEWHRALQPLGTDWRKPMLTDAPVVIVVFEVHQSEVEPKPYYTKESVGIAVGFLLAALHRMGLATLTHTPSPMRFLNEIVGRPRNERPFVVIPVGYPAEGATVPAIRRKPVDEIMEWIGAAQ
jgi:iodotyrosine deiodinase